MQAKMVDLAADLATSDIQATRIIRMRDAKWPKNGNSRSSAKAVVI
jgi:hypothetical protein